MSHRSLVICAKFSSLLSRPVLPGEVMTRLGLLLQQQQQQHSRHASPARPAHLHGADAANGASASSSNASPVSTLTGSSGADADAARCDAIDQSCDSLGSSLSMSLGCRSSSASPAPCFLASRRHSLTSTCRVLYFLYIKASTSSTMSLLVFLKSRTADWLMSWLVVTFLFVCLFVCVSAASQPGRVEDLNLFGKRQALIRRSARSGTVLGPIDPKGNANRNRFRQIKTKKELSHGSHRPT